MTLMILENVISSLDWPEDIILDGELCIFEDEKENFKKAVSEIKRQSGFIENPRYIIFDALTFEEFTSKTSKRIYSERLEHLVKLLNGKKFHPYIALAERIKVKDGNHLQKLRETATKKEWEGLILRKDYYYEGKRSNNMVKIKNFETDEFTVLSIETGPFRIVKNGEEKEIETMTALVIQIDDDGNTCSVGSGFTLEFREKCYENPNSIIGNKIGVKYFEKSKDKNGKPSLRFPIFLIDYGKMRTL